MQHYLKDIATIFQITFGILLFIALPLVLFTLMTSKTAVFGIKSYVVVSGSMAPSLPVGALVFAHQEATYQVGNVITFIRKDQTITHRIAAIVKDKGVIKYQTKGDANNVSDSELVSSKDVIGKVSYSAFYVGWLIHFLKTIPGFLVFVVLPVLVFISFEIKNIKKEIEKELKRKIYKDFESIPMIKQLMEVIEG